MEKKKTNMVAIVTMCFIFAMISFVTNMAAPFGNIWGNKFEWSKMAGNLMNFAAYLGLPHPAAQERDQEYGGEQGELQGRKVHRLADQ